MTTDRRFNPDASREERQRTHREILPADLRSLSPCDAEHCQPCGSCRDCLAASAWRNEAERLRRAPDRAVVDREIGNALLGLLGGSAEQHEVQRGYRVLREMVRNIHREHTRGTR